MNNSKSKAMKGIDEALNSKELIQLESRNPDVLKFRPRDQKLQIDQYILDLREPELPAVRVKAASKIVDIPWDGRSLISSVESSDVFKRRVHGFCSALAFCNGILQVAYMFPACGCKNTRYKEHSLAGIDFSYITIPRKRGCVVRKQCEKCGLWAHDAVFLETQALKSHQQLSQFIENYCQENHVRIPPDLGSITTK